VYSLVLRQLWDPEGLQKVADLFLHDAVPLFYLVFWATSVPKYTLRWQHAAWLLTYPLAYLLWALLRGSSTGMMCVFLILGVARVAVGRWRARHTTGS
jgi:hypothetical protein